MKQAALYLLVLVGILTGCATERRCYRKYPPTIETKTVTVVLDTTIYVPVRKFDTAFVALPGDTVRLVQDVGVRVTYVNLPGDTVYVDVVCPGDTIYVPIETTTTTTHVTTPAPPMSLERGVLQSLERLTVALAYLCGPVSCSLGT